VFVVACLFLSVAGSVACQQAGQVTAGAAVSQYSPLRTFPSLGPAMAVDRGVVLHQVSLAHAGLPGRIWIYLPDQLPPHPIPCVFIAPAGVPPYLGNGFGTDLSLQKHPEHLPYVRAGFAVVAYDTDGEVAGLADMSHEQLLSGATAFKNAEAGMVNARHAIDYVLKMVPAVDPRRLYSAGHSSAGRQALLLAESDPRIAACVAYAPVTDVEERVTPKAGWYLASHIAGFEEFLKRTSPLRNAAALHCPLFLFHAETDQRIPIADSVAFIETLKKTNAHVTFVRGAHGDHHSSMIEEGIPQAIPWLQQLSETKRGAR
jgi:dipeptidyl aminopeptidase/acylaminoacyl peptidase